MKKNYLTPELNVSFDFNSNWMLSSLDNNGDDIYWGGNE